MCHLALADETDCIKVTVYGSEKYKQLQEGCFYLLWGLILEESVVKVTSCSTIGQCGPLIIPPDLEEEAALLVALRAPPVSSIKEAKDSETDAFLAIEGTVTLDSGVHKVQPKGKQEMIEKRMLTLRDETGSIDVCLWRNHAKNRVTVGDCVNISNVKVNKYFDTISLSSTGKTTVKKVAPAAQKMMFLTIQAILKSTKKQVTLMTQTSEGQQTFTATTACLMKFFNMSCDEGFKEKLLSKIPTCVEAVVQGSKIISFKNKTA
ncbi:uncharacterized protein LOC118791183 [Megalops cyprinoides]|uniref:uncharacterized protein LOC118791183 n=1 Tax=Megalops cyprinoides TaxID=118141 RepID=UPI00186401DD|nr:uncharacterized protein LOC118791183 [Megalops cyprinoides]